MPFWGEWPFFVFSIRDGEFLPKTHNKVAKFPTNTNLAFKAKKLALMILKTLKKRLSKFIMSNKFLKRINTFYTANNCACIYFFGPKQQTCNFYSPPPNDRVLYLLMFNF